MVQASVTTNDNERKQQLPTSDLIASLEVSPQQSGDNNQEFQLPRQLSDGEFVVIEESKEPAQRPEHMRRSTQPDPILESRHRQGDEQERDRGRPPGVTASITSTSTGIG